MANRTNGTNTTLASITTIQYLPSPLQRLFTFEFSNNFNEYYLPCVNLTRQNAFGTYCLSQCLASIIFKWITGLEELSDTYHCNC